jgi:hypothetical protein
MLADDERARKFAKKEISDRPEISEKTAVGGEQAGKLRTLRSFGDSCLWQAGLSDRLGRHTFSVN